MTTRPSLQFSTSNRGRLPVASFLAGALLVLGWALFSSISTASAGEWVQRSCSYGTEYIVPEGWEGQEVNGYVNPANGGHPLDTCLGFNMGGGLWAGAAGANGDQPGAGEIWLYKPPRESTIAGGMLTVRMKAHNGDAQIDAEVKSGPTTLANCESPNCTERNEFVPITVSNATMLSEWAWCFAGHEPDLCPSEPEFAAEVGITSAQIVLSTNAVPSGSGFSGTLLNETVTGKGTLSFTAKDPGPGVYRAKVLIDGHEVWAGTPSLNEGKCVVTGTYESVRAFTYAQPCPAEAAVHAEVETAAVADGAHHLTVEVEDAAENVATVYSGTLTTANHPVAPIVLPPAPPNRGALNGTPASESAVVAVSGKQPKTFTRTLVASAVTLAGRLTDSAGTPIAGAQVQLLQQVLGTASPSRIATATTNAGGAWTFKVPKGPSRLLEVAYFSHLLDTTPAATLDFHESVQGTVSMHAPHRARLGHALIFAGQLAGGYVPAGGESVQVEIFYGSRWRTIEVLPTNRKGRWVYKYVFSLGVGASYLFRAVTVPNGAYPFMSAASKPVRIKVVG